LRRGGGQNEGGKVAKPVPLPAERKEEGEKATSYFVQCTSTGERKGDTIHVFCPSSWTSPKGQEKKKKGERVKKLLDLRDHGASRERIKRADDPPLRSEEDKKNKRVGGKERYLEDK